MSLDFDLTIDSCSYCGRDTETVYSGNYTHNVTSMWKTAGVYDALYMSDGEICSKYIGALNSGMEHMLNNPEVYLVLNPPNGWGDYYSAMDFLREVISAVLKYPSAIISICK